MAPIKAMQGYTLFGLFPHCTPHHRAKAAIEAAAFPRKGTGDPVEQAYFNEVFGKGKFPGDQAQEDWLLESFLEEHPDGQSKPGLSRCPKKLAQAKGDRAGSSKFNI